MGVGFCPQLGGVGPCPAQCIWQGSGFAADQTNAMLAVGGASCISLVSVAAADENSLTPLHRLLPTETASLGFGGSPVGGGDKNSRFAFFWRFYVGGGITTLGVRFMPSKRWACRGHGGLISSLSCTRSPSALRAHTAAHRGKHGAFSLPETSTGSIGSTA